MDCFNCKTNLDTLLSASKGALAPLDNDLILCPQCGGILIVNNTATRNITKEEYDALDPAEKNDLFFAVRAIQAVHRKLIDVDKPRIITPPTFNPRQ